MAETQRPPLAAPRSATPPRTANPFSTDEIAANARPNGAGLIAVEQQRAIAEVQARMIIARANPRDPIRAVESILNDCTRQSLADAATYEYSRGGTDIRGPSIRLAEAMAQRWGNIASGIKELARHDGYSECVAYAWDLESGFYDERQFQVRHWRDRREGRGGGYRLTDERDIYELIANFGQRRKRAVLLTVIPGDVTEAAVEQCERTMQAKADTSAEGVKKLVDVFAHFGVTQQQLETRIQRRLDAIRPAQMVQLRKIFNSLRDGMSDAADWFEPIEAAETAEAAPVANEARRHGRAAASAAPPASEPPGPEPPPPGEPPTHQRPPPSRRRSPQRRALGRAVSISRCRRMDIERVEIDPAETVATILDNAHDGTEIWLGEGKDRVIIRARQAAVRQLHVLLHGGRHQCA